MELDAAIQNALNRNPMESAMYGVGQDLGRQYELRALPRDISSTEDLLGVSLGIVGATEPRPIIPDVIDAGPVCGETILDTSIGAYKLAYEPATATWALYKPETVEKKFLLFIPYTTTDPGVKLKFSGTNSRNRFLTAIEDLGTISYDEKKLISQRVVSHCFRSRSSMDNAERETQPTEFIPSEGNVLNASADLAFGNFTVAEPPLDLALAPSYSGVGVLKNTASIFGDTVIPQPLTMPTVDELGNPLGQIVLPPVGMSMQ
jgi:hypothetical protein